MNIFLSTLLVLNLLIRSNCVEKTLRAYIPNSSVKWFDEFLRNNTKIDVWLSIRLNNFDNDKNETKYSQNFYQKHKYYCEFKVDDFDLIKQHKNDFEKHQIKLQVLIGDIKKHLNDSIKIIETDKKQKRNLLPTNKFLILENKVVNKYASYGDITRWMIELGKIYPDLVQVTKIGRTSERRPLFAIKITANIRNREAKPLFLFEGGIHAREWLSITTNIYLIDKIIKQYLDSDQNIINILKRFELHFIPVLNPDGYEYSKMSKFNRFWRKNMRYTKIHSSEYSCYGVDLNRNFDHKWMVSGASANPCSEVFSGPYPGSEPEIKALTKYIINKSPRWVSYISLHAYGAVWMSPFSYSKLHIQENFEETCQKAMLAIDKIEKLHNFKYRFGSSSHELYEASGCGVDWGKEIAKINHTYVIELKPEKSDEFEHSGFEYPQEKIEQVGIEMYDGFIEYIKSFLTKNVDKTIIKTCKEKLDDILKENQNFDYDGENNTIIEK